MDELTDELLAELGYDTSKEPFVNKSGRTTIYKNYIRDGSGNYDGYIVEHPKLKGVKTKKELINFIMK